MNPLFVGFYRRLIIPVFLNGGAKWISSIHSIIPCSEDSEIFADLTIHSVDFGIHRSPVGSKKQAPGRGPPTTQREFFWNRIFGTLPDTAPNHPERACLGRDANP